MLHVETFCARIWRDSDYYEKNLQALDSRINDSILVNSKTGSSVVSIDTIDASTNSHTVIVRTITYTDKKDTTCQQL